MAAEEPPAPTPPTTTPPLPADVATATVVVLIPEAPPTATSVVEATVVTDVTRVAFPVMVKVLTAPPKIRRVSKHDCLKTWKMTPSLTNLPRWW